MTYWFHYAGAEKHTGPHVWKQAPKEESKFWINIVFVKLKHLVRLQHGGSWSKKFRYISVETKVHLKHKWNKNRV